MKILVIDLDTKNQRLIDVSILEAYPDRFRRLNFDVKDVEIEPETENIIEIKGNLKRNSKTK